jgi:Tfp pilus assembly protein FimT
LLSDSAVLSLGAGSDFTITHDGTTGATLAGNPIVIDSGDALTLDAHTGVFTFKDAGTSVLSITEGNSGDVTIKLITNGKDLKFTDNGDAVGLTVLDGAAGITVAGEGDFGSLDVNGNADISGDLTLSAGADGALRFSAASSIKILDNSAASLVVEEADNAYMTFVTTNSSEAVKFDKALDINAAMDIDAAMQIDGTITVGVDDTGYDVKFFGATSGSSVLIDESADDVIFTNFGLAVGSDATGDIYYRNSSGYLARLAAGSNGHVLTLDSGIPSWAATSSDIGGSVGSTDNAVPRANGTGGATLQASSVIIDDSNNVTGVGNLTLSGEVDAATGDFSGAVDIAGDLTLSAGADGALRFSAASSIKILDNSATSLVIEEADNAYMTFVTTDSSEAIKFDVGLDVNAAVQIDSTVTVGVDDTGHDVKFFGATSGSSVLFDESADDMILTNYGLAVGSDATGDIYYRNSSGYLARLGKGTSGHYLKQGASIPEWAAVSSGGGGAYSDWEVKTANYTASTKDQLICNHASTAFTITLPSSPSAGNTVTVKNVGAATITIGRNSEPINSEAADGTLFTNSAVQLVYVDGTIGWTTL